MPIANELSTVAVIGAGQMGTGIAEVVAKHGHEAFVYDLDKARIRASIETSAGYFRWQVETGKMPGETAEQAISRIKAAFSLSAAEGLGARRLCRTVNPLPSGRGL
ncbi:3-hydroxybutyryl-CoA dehydrogenase domain-containing protein (plasmid) [Rhizobium etli 8C-3]|uniref:3-hydroxybutyryl-CoA dehydrogenase domain-containing protein n=1 Tax=Rhizobium etli 8C-3 TaxID=538025 RepID=A0A1L5PHL3_RHIET|nr:3-hydroxyacyl-CoA dehydrogenase NAD-binding domain-containing protein [Rhizobium etli]APO79641.1 3-hydroxybutyryl-CoA dehydrogenase domain-containing protein [Rhizobium etli 8C-3]